MTCAETSPSSDEFNSLHDLVLEYLSRVGVNRRFVAAMRAELWGAAGHDEDSRLYELVKFAEKGTFKVSVSTLAGHLCEVEVTYVTTVQELKGTIESRSGNTPPRPDACSWYIYNAK